MGRLVCAALACAGLAACGSSEAGFTLTRNPTQYLLRLDELVTSDFSVYIAAHSIDSSDIAGSDATRARQLASDALQSAATVRYARDANFATSNGPIDVISTVERFASSTGAAHSYGIDVHALDAFPQAVPLATGTLGDASHADSVVRTTSSGFQAVQITVEWRLANVVNILVVRGRYGGARLVDALTLAHREATNEIR